MSLAEVYAILRAPYPIQRVDPRCGGVAYPRAVAAYNLAKTLISLNCANSETVAACRHAIDSLVRAYYYTPAKWEQYR